jgi:hypothetical protein
MTLAEMQPRGILDMFEASSSLSSEKSDNQAVGVWKLKIASDWLCDNCQKLDPVGPAGRSRPDVL